MSPHKATGTDSREYRDISGSIRAWHRNSSGNQVWRHSGSITTDSSQVALERGRARLASWHRWRRHCQRQKLIGTSTAEAKLKYLLQGMGETVAIKIGVDASAGKAMASRRGLGSATHVQVQYFWVQSLVQDGSIVLVKIPGEEN